MKITSFEEVQQYKDAYNFVPVCKEILADTFTPINILEKLAITGKNYYLLESAEMNYQWSRYSFLGYQPIKRIFCKNKKAYMEENQQVKKLAKDPLTELDELISQYKSPRIKSMPSFTGGLVGYFSYEMIGYKEPKLKIKENEFYDFDLMLFQDVIVYDHQKHTLLIIGNMNPDRGKTEYEKTIHRIKEIETLIFSKQTAHLEKLNVSEKDKHPHFMCNTTQDEYRKMVEKTKQYIYEGDVFQAVISRKFIARYESSLFNTYRILRTNNPSPYMYFININEIEIAGASPETMVKVENNKITTFPVAGTRKRGKDDQEDARLEQELLGDEKEKAEHNMLVDLARNDVGRVASYGSVEVEEYMAIHRFSKVMHIASTVTGTLDKGKKSFEAIESLLPAGTLSGAPKFRACEIINELEKESRGIYGGAIGYLDFSGNLDVCIAIRTAVKKDKKVCIQAGAGIVADSIPQMEYEECESKARAVIDAVKNAGEVKKYDTCD